MKKNWISIKRGLNTPEHRNKMGETIWLFLEIIDLADWETGTIPEWIDSVIAEDIEMNIKTLRRHRQKLESEGYITCVQKQHHQKIIIHAWVNPRNYSGKIKNPKNQGGHARVPSIQGGHLCPQGNHQVGTPTFNSIRINNDNNREIPTFGDIIATYESQSGTISGFIAEELIAAVDEWDKHKSKLPDPHPDKNKNTFQVIIDAITQMGKHITPPNLTYLDKILINWRQNGHLAEKPSKRKRANNGNLSTKELEAKRAKKQKSAKTRLSNAKKRSPK